MGAPESIQPLPRRRQHPPASEKASHDRWVVSYADFVTLLFALFTMLYASSNLDAKKLKATVESLQNAFDRGGLWHTKAGTTKIGGPPQLGEKPNESSQPGLADLHARLTKRLEKAIRQQWVNVQIERRGLVISIREVGSFGAGSAELSPDAQAALEDVRGALALVDNPVRVEGHTDDVPIHTARFASNWELSTARATRVVALLLENSNISPERVSAAGYAEFHPQVPNTSAASRALNRRVDLVVLNPSTQLAEEARPFTATDVQR